MELGFLLSWNTTKILQTLDTSFHAYFKNLNSTMAFWATIQIWPPNWPIGQQFFAISSSVIKKPSTGSNFVHVFKILPSSRYENQWQMLKTIFMESQDSRNILWNLRRLTRNNTDFSIPYVGSRHCTCLVFYVSLFVFFWLCATLYIQPTQHNFWSKV